MTKLQEEIEALKEMLKVKQYAKETLEKDLLKNKLSITMIEKEIFEKEKQSCGE